MEESNSNFKKNKSFFKIGGIAIAIAIIIFLLGSLFTIGLFSIVSRSTPVELLKGNAGKATQVVQVQQNSPVDQKIQSDVTSAPDASTGAISTSVSSAGVLGVLDQAISSVSEQVLPSVVNIQVSINQQDIFGNTQQAEGVGSGVIYKSDGYIITNNHVAGDAIKLTVTLSDGTEYPAKLVGTDKDTDIAVIKIDAQNLKPAEFSSIKQVKVGEIALALGSPFGLEKSVTMGVVSALGREIQVSADTIPMVDLIQTDATINPGNSGGPLVNSEGKVIGINTLIYSTSGTSAGVGFSIPSDTAINIANQIIKYGKSRIPFIGIEMGDNTSNVKGVVVKSVTGGYPAEKAGIKAGDIITEFDGSSTLTPYEFLAQIIRHNVGDKVNIKIYRNGSYLTISLVLIERPAGIQSTQDTTQTTQ
jgi:serine protease Do